jgi:hypothetical protein
MAFTRARTPSSQSVHFDEPEAHPPPPFDMAASTGLPLPPVYAAVPARTPKVVQSTIVGAALTSPGSFPVPVSAITVGEPVTQVDGSSATYVTYLVRFYLPNTVA